MDACLGMAESLCCPPETIAALLIGHTSVKNKKLKKKGKLGRSSNLVVQTLSFQCREYRFNSLIRELRLHMLCSAAK